MKIFPTRQLEEKLLAQGYKAIAGVDEVGRGALAGPMVAVACILKNDVECDMLCDSKQLSKKQREEIFDLLKESVVSYGVGVVESFEIDSFGVTTATQLAFRRALNVLTPRCDYIVTDAFPVNDASIPCEAIIKADEKIMTVAASSVIAKVTRDAMMEELAKKYPQYGFDKHVGYGTAEHIQAIRKYGALPIHRRLFLRSYVESSVISYHL